MVECGYPSDDKGVRDEQLRLEAKAQKRAALAERSVETSTEEVPKDLDDALGIIFVNVLYKLALNWKSKVEDARDLNLVSETTPHVINGTLPTGEVVFLSSETGFLGLRKNVFGTKDGEQVSQKEARKLIRRYASVLKKRKKEQYKRM